MDFTPIIPQIWGKLDGIFPVTFFIARFKLLGQNYHSEFSLLLTLKQGKCTSSNLYFLYSKYVWLHHADPQSCWICLGTAALPLLHS